MTKNDQDLARDRTLWLMYIEHIMIFPEKATICITVLIIYMICHGTYKMIFRRLLKQHGMLDKLHINPHIISRGKKVNCHWGVKAPVHGYFYPCQVRVGSYREPRLNKQQK